MGPPTHLTKELYDALIDIFVRIVELTDNGLCLGLEGHSERARDWGGCGKWGMNLAHCGWLWLVCLLREGRGRKRGLGCERSQSGLSR